MRKITYRHIGFFEDKIYFFIARPLFSLIILLVPYTYYNALYTNLRNVIIIIYSLNILLFDALNGLLKELGKILAKKPKKDARGRLFLVYRYGIFSHDCAVLEEDRQGLPAESG